MRQDSDLQVSLSRRPTRERIGLIVNGTNAAAAIKTIAAAETAGVQQIWMTQPPWSPDILTTLAAAAIKTSTVRLGTAIIPTYTRHPVVLAQQVLVLNDIAPGRLRLGIGPSHRAIVEDIYGLPQTTPLVHLREYVKVLRSILWDGRVDHHGEFFNIVIEFLTTAQIPVLISTLRKRAFQLAGEIADGALSWMCPVPYLLNTGIPLLRKGATANGRPNPPPLVAHVPVALSQDRDSVMIAGHKMFETYSKLPFYAKMFADAGFPLTADKKVTGEFVNNMIISGNEDTISTSLTKLLDADLDEIMVSLVPIVDEKYEQTRLMRLIGQL
ncbi:MAG TPA: LLM class flavin-dependent oxidoreductase [Nitrososphaeraceae archaeon]|nr:LLM class flavin-dependent oxidoreductase [Nitrososphaeraceae archaeon]